MPNFSVNSVQCPEDFSGWGGDSREPGAEQWTYEKLSPYFRRFEGFNPNESFPVDDSQRGTDGPVKVRFTHTHPTSDTAATRRQATTRIMGRGLVHL